MYLVFTKKKKKKNKNYFQIRNNNNNVYTIKICGMYKLYNKTVGILKVVSKNCKGYSSYCCCLRVTFGLFSYNVLFERFNIRGAFQFNI